MKKLIITFILLLSCAWGFDLSEYYKIYPKEPDELFMIALSAINTSKLQVVEVQTRHGYILFSDNINFYLLTLTKRYKNQTEIKIVPQNSDFSKGSSVPKSIFSAISAKLNQPLELVK